MLKMLVLNDEFNLQGSISEFNYLSYTVNYSSVGSFEIKCPVTENNIKLIKDNAIIWFEDDVAGLVQYIEKDRDTTTSMVVKGKTMEVVLEWRNVFPMYQGTANPAIMMENVVTENCISSSDENRNFNFLEVDNSNFTIDSITKQKTGGSVEEFCEELCSTTNLGFKVYITKKTPTKACLKFKVLQGVDRTEFRGNIKQVRFSQKLNNILKIDYVKNSEPYRNVAVVVAEKTEETTDEVSGDVNETTKRFTRFIYDGNIIPRGFYRREMYVDARDLQSEKEDDEGNETTLSDEEYTNIVDERGREKLSEQRSAESFNGEVLNEPTSQYVFGEHYNLGDIVVVEDEEMGVQANVRCTSVVITYDQTGKSVEPAFGFETPTLIKKLKKKGVL